MTKLYSKTLLVCFTFMFCFTDCCSAKKLQEIAPTNFTSVYYQTWVSGVEGGGSGVNVFIEINEKGIDLDSIYFRQRVAKLETKPNLELLYIGRFPNKAQASKIDSEFPFRLNDNECVVSYLIDGKVKYYKISYMEQRASEEFPSTQKKDAYMKQ